MRSAAEFNKLRNLTRKVEERLRLLETPLTDQELEVKARCEDSLYEFTKECWSSIEGRPFIPGWHLEVIAAHLEALAKLEIKDLIINQPFRTGKSLMGAVIYPAWVWATWPHLRFLYGSYSQRLSIRDSTACRRLILSAWYQRLWGKTVRLHEDAQNLQKFDNIRGGSRMCTSMGGTVTGFGGDFIVVDDPNNVTTMESILLKEKVNETYDATYSSRYTLLEERRRLIMQQRIDPQDLTGHICSKNDPNWVHLWLPMEFERDRRCATIVLPRLGDQVWCDPRVHDGDLLWPKGINEDDLDRLKNFDLNGDSYRIAGQLQQRPTPAGGGILKTEWFKLWKGELPDFTYVIQSWDTAFTNKATGAASACTTWGVFQSENRYQVMLISVFAGMVSYPELRQMAKRLGEDYLDTYIDDPLPPHRGVPRRPDLVMIEEKASGHILVNDLMVANLPVIGFNPGKYGDKRARCGIVSHLIENGLVWIPAEEPNYVRPTEEARLFLEAASLFPKSRPGSATNDIIDSMSQAFIRLKTSGWLFNTDDPVFEESEDSALQWRYRHVS